MWMGPETERSKLSKSCLKITRYGLRVKLPRIALENVCAFIKHDCRMEQEVLSHCSSCELYKMKGGAGISCHVSFYECLSNQRFSGHFEQDLGPLSSCVELYSVYSVTKMFDS